MDSLSDRVYEFSSARSRTSGSQSPAANFALAAGNTNPQGIADPPAAASQRSEIGGPSVVRGGGHSPPYEGHDAALLSLGEELENLLGNRKRR